MKAVAPIHGLERGLANLTHLQTRPFTSDDRACVGRGGTRRGHVGDDDERRNDGKRNPVGPTYMSHPTTQLLSRASVKRAEVRLSLHGPLRCSARSIDGSLFL